MSSLLRRELFGPVREDIWRQLAAEMGASFIDEGFWKGGAKVEASHGEWRITLEGAMIGKLPGTLMRAQFCEPRWLSLQGLSEAGFQ